MVGGVRISMWLNLRKKVKSITVDQVRASNRWAQQSSQLGSLRVILLNPAEAMNESASNALLKTLEPASNCIFILSTRNSNRLILSYS